MTSMRAPALRYVEPAVATMVASTLSPMWSFERSSMSSTLVSRRTARTAAVGAGPSTAADRRRTMRLRNSSPSIQCAPRVSLVNERIAAPGTTPRRTIGWHCIFM
jgi:hypothetical protein